MGLVSSERALVRVEGETGDERHVVSNERIIIILLLPSTLAHILCKI